MHNNTRLDATRAEWEEKVQGEIANPLADMDVFDSETAGTTNEKGADAFESELPRDQEKTPNEEGADAFESESPRDQKKKNKK